MIQWIRELLGLGVAEQWIAAGLLGGLGFLILVAFLHAGAYIHRYGFVNYLKASFRINEDSWGLIILLIMVAALATLAFWRR
jgi:hypothetical protein